MDKSKLKPPPSSLAWGSFYLLLARFMSSSKFAVIKEAELVVSFWVILFAQAVVGFCVGLPFFIKKRKEIRRFKSWKYLCVRTLVMAVGLGCIYFALKHVELVSVTLLANTTPIFIPIVAYFWLNTKIPKPMYYTIGIGFVGILCILRPSLDLIYHPIILIPIIAGVCFSFSQILLRLLADKGETPMGILFYYLIFLGVLTLPGAFFFWQHISTKFYLLFIAGGVLSFCQQVSILKAFNYAHPVQIGPLNYSAVVFSYLLGWLFFNEQITWLVGIGIALVIIGGVSTIYIDKKLHFEPDT